MDASEVLENWSDFESDGDDVSSEEYEESEDEVEDSSSDDDSATVGPDGWKEVPGLCRHYRECK